MTRVKFTRFGSSTACGNFQPGDLFTCGEALAKHFVDELRVAVYLTPAAPVAQPEQPAPAIEVEPEPRKPRGRGKK